MNNLSLAFSVVFPLFCMMSLGYFLRAIMLFDEAFLTQLNALCFQVFLPTVLFANIYKSDFRALFSVKLIAFALVSIGVAFAFLMFTVARLEPTRENRGVMVQGIFRSNFILFGIPMASALYGEENTSVTAILLAFVIPLFNLLSILALEAFGAQKKKPIALLKEVLKNPLIVASILAFFFVITGLRMPVVLEATVSDIAKVATPLALIVLGGSFEFRSLTRHIVPLCVCVLGKLVLMPLVFLPLAIAAGFRGLELVALLGMYASPTAVSTFTMAQRSHANDTLAGQIVVVGSIASVVSIFIAIGILKGLHLI